jgi:hypothetical protein
MQQDCVSANRAVMIGDLSDDHYHHERRAALSRREVGRDHLIQRELIALVAAESDARRNPTDKETDECDFKGTPVGDDSVYFNEGNRPGNGGKSRVKSARDKHIAATRRDER